MRDFAEISQITLDLQRQQGPTIERMREVLLRYEGDWLLPVPDLPNEPKLPPLTPMLIAEAVDSISTRAAGVKPTVSCAAVEPNKSHGKRSVEFAQKRRRALSYVYEESKWGLGRRRFYRQLAAYHTSAIVVTPDFDKGLPHVGVRDPLGTFVDPRNSETLQPPEYAAFVTRYSGSDLRLKFKAVCSEYGGPISPDEQAQMWDIVEWIDMEQTVFGLLGPVTTYGSHINNQFASFPNMALQLGPSYPNKAGMCTVCMPSNVSLGRIASRMAAMVGNVDLQARLVALDVAAQTRSIFPDFYVLGSENKQPRLISGDWQPGSSGRVNMVADANSVGLLHMTPDPRTSQMIDRQERNFRVSTGLVPQMGGETYGALRTGAGINALAGMAVDPMIQELHEIHETWMRHTNEAILATWKGYWPDRKYTVFSGWAGDRGELEFVPADHVETLNNTVSYAIAGADVVQQTQILGSLAGAEAISLETFRTMHPYVEDAELERLRVNREGLERALMQSLANGLAQGTMPPQLASLIDGHLLEGESLFRAVDTANRELQAQQAAAPPVAPEGMMAHPDQMPGIAGGPGSMMAPAAPPDEQGVTVPTDAVAMKSIMRAMTPVSGRVR